MNTRLTAIYRGEVQGVGFRFTAVRIASEHAVAGYVRNTHDGTVELVAEGTQAELERFASAVEREMGGNIRRVERGWSPATEEFRGFTVKFQ